MSSNPTTWRLTMIVWVAAVVVLFGRASGQEPHQGIVRIHNDLGRYSDVGSGTVITHSGGTYVITCGHLFRDGVGSVSVAGRSARVVAVDQGSDLAVLACADLNSAIAFPVASDYPQPGEPIACAGFGSGQYRAVRGAMLGYVATKGQLGRTNLEVRCAVRSGDSGGPMLNTQGEMVGVIWGSDGKTTFGAYCGRINQFLDAKLPSKLVAQTSGYG